MSNQALQAVAGSGNDSTAVGREATPYERFRDYVSRPAFHADLRKLLGSDATVHAFVRVVLTAVQQTPDLLSADRRTLLLACMKAAHARLMPDGKEAVFNIYSTKVKDRDGKETWVKQVQFLPMAFGLVKSLYDSGIATYVDAAAVYEKDFFSYRRGDKQSLEHEPTMVDEPGPVIAAYCVVTLASGATKREVMPRRDIEKVRAISKSPDGLMWGKFYDQGAIKSVIHRICKQLPSRPELEAALGDDREAMGIVQQNGSGINVDTDSFSGTPTMEERPALEYDAGETIPPIIGKEREAEKVAPRKPTVDKSTGEVTGNGHTEPSQYAIVREAIDAAGKAKDDKRMTAAAEAIGTVPEQFRQELTGLVADWRASWQ